MEVNRPSSSKDRAGATALSVFVATGFFPFDTYPRDTCGLTEATRCYYGRYVRDLLAARLGTGRVDVAALTLADVAAFVTARAAHLAPGRHAIATGVRSLLRFLQLRGLGARELRRVPHDPGLVHETTGISAPCGCRFRGSPFDQGTRSGPRRSA